MIDKDTLRIARRTAERNGYTVLPPRDQDERDLSRFRDRQRERENLRARRVEEDDEDVEPAPRFKPLRTRDDEEPVRTSRPTPRPKYHDEDEEPVRRPVRASRYEEDDEEPVRRPVRTRYEEDDVEPVRKSARTTNYEDDEPVRRTPRYEDDEPARKPAPRQKARYYDDEEYEDVPARKPAPRYREVVDDYEDRPKARFLSKEDEIRLARQTVEDNGYSVRKLSKLDLAKQVAKEHGFDVRKVEQEPAQTKPAPTAASEDDNTTNDRPVRRVATRDGAPIRRPVVNREFTRSAANDGVRTRTAPDVEFKKDQQVPPVEPETKPVEPQAQAEESPKKPTFEDDYVNRAAAFFGDEN